MDQNGQPIGHAYAYYSSGEEDFVAATGVAYGGQVQHQYVMQYAALPFLHEFIKFACSRRRGGTQVVVARMSPAT